MLSGLRSSFVKYGAGGAYQNCLHCATLGNTAGNLHMEPGFLGTTGDCRTEFSQPLHIRYKALECHHQADLMSAGWNLEAGQVLQGKEGWQGQCCQ